MAKDLFHNEVRIALEKDGWQITHDPYRLRYGVADIYIDLAAEEAIRLNPDFADAYSNHGLEKSELGDKQGAIADYNEVIRLNPDYALAYYNRGLIKKERGEKQEALADFRKALELYQQQGNTEWYSNSRDRIKDLAGWFHFLKG